MTVKDKAKKELESLMNYFSRNEAALKQGDSNEDEVIRHYISPMFRALGWDFNNDKRKDLHKLEVRAQITFKANNRDYRPDFNFNYSGGDVAFYLDAKAVPVHLDRDKNSALQVRGYGWNDKKPVCVLTDFQEFAVYNCTIEPKLSDSVKVGLIKYIKYEDYLKDQNFDFLWSYFLKDNVHNKSLEKLIKSDGYIKGGITVDKHFLNSLNRWRELLALGIKKNNTGIDEEVLNYLVQQTLDRILFLRICEARNIESNQKLYKKIVTVPNAYDNLIQYYFEADKKYNSGLFDFVQDTTSAQIHIDNATLSTIVHELYPPFSPYRFDVIPVEIIGSAYEQFLGNEIRIERNKIVIEQKLDVRKAGGVYYTPQYIVNCIVEKTIGKLIDNKTPEQISKIKILDPSCGSGSFLLGVYQFLLNYHLDYYLKNRSKLKSIPVGEDGKLTTIEKKRILNNNIFGVDLDKRAVEIAKLSLLLKVLEDETSDTLADERLLGFKEKVLPNLDMNIKCGNSLIGRDFKQTTPSVISKKEVAEISPFDWHIMFSQVYKQGGFDCIVGNPPYGATLSAYSEQYFRAHYEVANYQLDTYILFVERATHLMKQGGVLGYIIPNTWLLNLKSSSVRKYILKQVQIKEIVNYANPVFVDAVVDTQILIFENSAPNLSSEVQITIYDKQNISTLNLIEQGKWVKLNGEPINIVERKEFDTIKSKMSKFSILDEACKITQGTKPFQVGKGVPKQTREIVDNKPFVSEIKNNKHFRPLLRGSLINKYETNWDNNYWIKFGEWLAEPRYSADYEAAVKIVVRQTGDSIVATIDQKQFIVRDNLYTIVTKDKNVNLYYVLGLLNSSFMKWYYQNIINPEKGEALAQVKRGHLAVLPIPLPNDNVEKAYNRQVISHVENILAWKEAIKLQEKKDTRVLEDKINDTYLMIDKLVYLIYGLNQTDINIIENT